MPGHHQCPGVTAVSDTSATRRHNWPPIKEVAISRHGTKLSGARIAYWYKSVSMDRSDITGGGYWEAMKGEMTGWFEVRVDGPQRHHSRLLCRLDYDAAERDSPLLVVIAGLAKPFQTKLSQADYADVRALGNEYFARNPRSLA